MSETYSPWEPSRCIQDKRLGFEELHDDPRPSPAKNLRLYFSEVGHEDYVFRLAFDRPFLYRKMNEIFDWRACWRRPNPRDAKLTPIMLVNRSEWRSYLFEQSKVPLPPLTSESLHFLVSLENHVVDVLTVSEPSLEKLPRKEVAEIAQEFDETWMEQQKKNLKGKD